MAPKLSQEEFDDAVKTNIEDFDMEADEAVASAVEEFKLQGYNLDGIIKSSTGGNTDSHPIAVATRELTQAAAAATVSPAALQQSVCALQQQFKGLNSNDLQQALAVANKDGTVAALLAAAKAATAAQQPASSTTAASGGSPQVDCSAVLVACLRTLRILMQLPDCRGAFITAEGPALLLQLLQDCSKALGDTHNTQQQQEQQQQQYQLAAAIGALAEAAAWQDEEAKCIFMQDGFAAALLTLLQHISTSHALSRDTPALATAAAAAGAAAGALRAFTTADDERPQASKAFLHARLLAGPPHNTLAVLLPVLRGLQDLGDPLPVGPLTAVLGAVRQIAANDEICKSFAEAGGVSALLALLSAAVGGGPPELVRGSAAALRQLANSDAIKAQLAEEGVLPVLLRGVRVYGSGALEVQGALAVQEQLLGLLVALVLRMPDISAAAAEAGAVEVLTGVLAAAPILKLAHTVAQLGTGKAKAEAAATGNDADAEDLASRVFGVGISGSNGGSGAAAAAAVQRQACMAVRNMAVRNPELRPAFLAAGCEKLLRGVKVLYPGACKDVGSAALRDLGLDNYQD